jgi:hypothetical protein
VVIYGYQTIIILILNTIHLLRVYLWYIRYLLLILSVLPDVLHRILQLALFNTKIRIRIYNLKRILILPDDDAAESKHVVTVYI